MKLIIRVDNSIHNYDKYRFVIFNDDKGFFTGDPLFPWSKESEKVVFTLPTFTDVDDVFSFLVYSNRDKENYLIIPVPTNDTIISILNFNFI